MSEGPRVVTYKELTKLCEPFLDRHFNNLEAHIPKEWHLVIDPKEEAQPVFPCAVYLSPGQLRIIPSAAVSDITIKVVTGPTEGIKNDSEKVRMDLLSRSALEGVSQVLTYGAQKYAPDNWRKGMEWRRLIGAAMRHLQAFSDGEDMDPESGLPHIDHLGCCVMFLSEYQKKKMGTDDRWKGATETSSTTQAPLSETSEEFIRAVKERMLRAPNNEEFKK